MSTAKKINEILTVQYGYLNVEAFQRILNLVEEEKKALNMADVVISEERAELKTEVFTLANKLAMADEGDAAVAMHRIHNRL